MVDEAGALRQLLGLGEAVSHSTSQGSIHRNTKRHRFFSVTLTSTQYFCSMPQSSTAGRQGETTGTNGPHAPRLAPAAAPKSVF